MFVLTSLFLILATFAVAQTGAEQFPTYKCFVNGESCILLEVNLTFEEPYFNITVDKNPANIYEVTLSNSIIPRLSNSICSVFPAVETLNAEAVGIEYIMDDAFHGCTELKRINLMRNKIKSFNSPTFQKNVKLTALYLETNRIKKLKYGSFKNLENLEFLMLGNNNLTEFAPELLNDSPKLTSIYLYTNNLSDLDIETIHHLWNPNITSIHLNNNEFSCVRMQEMLDFAKV